MKIKTSALLVAAMLAAGMVASGGTSTAYAATSGSSSSQFQLDIGGQTVDISDGESVNVGMAALETSHVPRMLISPNATYSGNCGYLTVSASAGVFHWSITMTCPATTFSGSFSIIDTNNGQSGGLVSTTRFSGSAPTSRLHGHRYLGTLSGQALLLGVPVAATMPNNTSYKYP
ncbi:hypothetical protein LK09_17095 [Microbacterium mangrovi]|uniref:Uncharacterized protein n=1 Tax=Microbacterium mangrovi TaxID=1348253 RepID=A0A0B2A2K5_9MICO|nr:hypothetical protein [Microbacterium mangrovi]KHK96059.1 hypothetical protein LK09_17095 [Microbacterium mangrovi]